MKFCENGPDIPNSLILERDAGRVVFICGAGVSMHSSKLPNFSQLASRVMDELLVPKDDKIREHLEQTNTETKGKYVSIDRVFSQLEQDYDTYEIEYAISKILSLSPHANTDCHRVIYDLATARNCTRLVTTNFDDLFSRVKDDNCGEMSYPNLSTVSDSTKFSCLAYLHGKCVGKNIPDDSELVLSSRSFGKAYLVDGNASQFLKSIFSNFTIVFVGYSSDDPPIQYLLEALAQTDSVHYSVYAFQKEEIESNSERWLFQKVKPIYFKEYDDLWDTLGHWSNYSKDPKSWTNSVLKMAEKGPFSLTEWQRSQVAYLVSSAEGAGAISKHHPHLPSQWLFCFDPKFRYALPKGYNLYRSTLNESDPFKSLGLLEDTGPQQQRLGERVPTDRSTPTDAWDAFDSASKYPERDLDNSSKSLKVDQNTKLRNEHLSSWIANISDQSETFCWAILRENINKDLRQKIVKKITRKLQESPSYKKLNWNIVFENWDLNDEDCQKCFSELKVNIKEHGWSSRYVKEYKKLSKPILSGNKRNFYKVIFPEEDSALNISDFTYITMNRNLEDIVITDSEDLTIKILKIERRNLDTIIEYMKQKRTYMDWNYPSLYSQKTGRELDKNHRKNMPIVHYAERLKQLVEISPRRAKAEFKSWPKNDLNVFGRFRIWAASDNRIVNDKDAADLFSTLPQSLFWGRKHREDLRHSLKARWNSLPISTIELIEKRILRGYEPRVDINIHENFERSSAAAVEFCSWIVNSNLKVSSNFVREYRAIKINQRPTRDMRSVTTSDRRNVKIRNIDIPIEELRRLCKSRLSLVLIYLRQKAKVGEYPHRAWRSVLTSRDNRQWTKRRIWYAAMLIRSAPDDFFEYMGDAATIWFSEFLAPYDDYNLSIRDEIFDRLTNMIEYETMYDWYGDFSRQAGEVGWIVSHRVSNSGQLAKALFRYKEVREQNDDSVVPEFWLDALGKLVSLPGKNGQYALSYLAGKITWLYKSAPIWTKSNIFSNYLTSDYLTSEAYWVGFFNYEVSIGDIDYDLYIEMKPYLVTRLSRPISSKSYIAMILSSLLFTGWCRRRDGRRWISSSEFCTILKNSSDEFRNQILGRLKDYASSSISEGNYNWISNIEQFFRNVWPRTRSAKSKVFIRRMIDLTFFDPKLSKRLSLTIIPRLGRISHDHPAVAYLLNNHMNVIKNYPLETFEFLYALLKNCSQDFPADTKRALVEIEKNYSRIRKDRRFRDILKLVRK